MLRISRFFITMAIMGWGGVFLCFLMPIMKYSVSDDIYVDPYYDPIWLIGILMALVAGATILFGKKNKFRRVGLMITIIGGFSGLFFCISYFT